MTLMLPDGVKTLAPKDAPFGFSGEASCDAVLHDKPLLDLNVMVRRPLKAAVITNNTTMFPKTDYGHTLRAAYLFAPNDNLSLGLRKYDLMALHGDVPETIPYDTLLILIFDG